MVLKCDKKILLSLLLFVLQHTVFRTYRELSFTFMWFCRRLAELHWTGV